MKINSKYLITPFVWLTQHLVQNASPAPVQSDNLPEIADYPLPNGAPGPESLPKGDFLPIRPMQKAGYRTGSRSFKTNQGQLLADLAAAISRATQRNL